MKDCNRRPGDLESLEEAEAIMEYVRRLREGANKKTKHEVDLILKGADPVWLLRDTSKVKGNE